MTRLQSATARANATVRLCSAREALWRAESRHALARGTPAEAWTLRRVGEATAELATREEWLHWITRGTTIRPAADGEWGMAPGTELAVDERPAEARTARVGAPRHHTGSLRSVR